MRFLRFAPKSIMETCSFPALVNRLPHCTLVMLEQLALASHSPTPSPEQSDESQALFFATIQKEGDVYSLSSFQNIHSPAKQDRERTEKKAFIPVIFLTDAFPAETAMALPAPWRTSITVEQSWKKRFWMSFLPWLPSPNSPH